MEIVFDEVFSTFERISKRRIENIEAHTNLLSCLQDKIENHLKNEFIAQKLHQQRELILKSLERQVELDKNEINHQIEQAKKKNYKTNKSQIRKIIAKRVAFVYLHQSNTQNNSIQTKYFGYLKKANFDLMFFLKYNHLLDDFSTKYSQTENPKCVLNVKMDSNSLIEICKVEKDYYEVRLVNLNNLKVINTIKFTFVYEFSDENIKVNVANDSKKVLIIKRESSSFLLELYDFELNLIRKTQLSRSVLPLHSSFTSFLNKNELIISLSSCSYLLVYDLCNLEFKQFLGQDKKRQSEFYMTANKQMIQVKNDNIVFIDSDPINFKVKYLKIMSRGTGFLKSSISIGRESTGKLIIDLFNDQVAIEKFDDSLEDQLYFAVYNFDGEQFFKTKSYFLDAQLRNQPFLVNIPCSIRNFNLFEFIND